jgi:hypothetical protein
MLMHIAASRSLLPSDMAGTETNDKSSPKYISRPHTNLPAATSSRRTPSRDPGRKRSTPSMATEAQIRANQENAQNSTGPNSAAGKAASSRNNFRHGFTGAFYLLPTENQSQFAGLLESLRNEHAPSTITEALLVENMAQSFWLGQRAVAFQNECLADEEISPAERDRQLSLYLRYQTTHDRAFHRCLNQLLKLRAEKRKAEIGFESQKQKQDIISIRQSAEKRRQEHHKWDVLLAEAKADHQLLLNSNLEFDQKMAAARQNGALEGRNGF